MPLLFLIVVGDGKLSYIDVSRYTVTGLPEGLTFHRPSSYGRKQLEQILEKEATLVIKGIHLSRV